MLANAARTGIELSGWRCAVAVARRAGVSRKDPAILRLEKFVTFENADNQVVLVADLKELVESNAVPKHAWLTVWGVRHVHRYTWFAAARQKHLQKAVQDEGARALGLDKRDVEVAIVRGADLDEPEKFELSFLAAASSDVRKKVALVEAAGFVVDGVTTAAGALWSQARLRPSIVQTDVQAYVAIGALRSVLVIVCNGFMLYGREMSWGYAHADDVFPAMRPRLDIATELAGELRRSFLYVKQFCEEDVSQVFLCGEMPEIRSLTAPLIEQLGIEVETLDSLDGIDLSGLPDSGEMFTDHVAAMRLAAAVSAAGAPVNLRPVPSASIVSTHAVRYAAVAVGLVAAVGAAALLYERSTDHSPSLGSAATSSPRYIEHQSAAVLPSRAAPSEMAGLKSRPTDGVPTSRPTDAGRASRAAEPLPSHGVGSPNAGGTPAVRVMRQGPAAGEPDPVVRTILYSEQRQVAVVNGQIVAPGDRLGAGLIEAIEPRAVIYVTNDGQVKRLPLDEPGGPANAR